MKEMEYIFCFVLFFHLLIFLRENYKNFWCVYIEEQKADMNMEVGFPISITDAEYPVQRLKFDKSILFIPPYATPFVYTKNEETKELVLKFHNAHFLQIKSVSYPRSRFLWKQLFYMEDGQTPYFQVHVDNPYTTTVFKTLVRTNPDLLRERHVCRLYKPLAEGLDSGISLHTLTPAPAPAPATAADKSSQNNNNKNGLQFYDPQSMDDETRARFGLGQRYEVATYSFPGDLVASQKIPALTCTNQMATIFIATLAERYITREQLSQDRLIGFRPFVATFQFRDLANTATLHKEKQIITFRTALDHLKPLVTLQEWKAGRSVQDVQQLEARIAAFLSVAKHSAMSFHWKVYDTSRRDLNIFCTMDEEWRKTKIAVERVEIMIDTIDTGLWMFKIPCHEFVRNGWDMNGKNVQEYCVDGGFIVTNMFVEEEDRILLADYADFKSVLYPKKRRRFTFLPPPPSTVQVESPSSSSSLSSKPILVESIQDTTHTTRHEPPIVKSTNNEDNKHDVFRETLGQRQPSVLPSFSWTTEHPIPDVFRQENDDDDFSLLANPLQNPVFSSLYSQLADPYWMENTTTSTTTSTTTGVVPSNTFSPPFL